MAANNKDDVYAKPVEQLQAFEFNAQVADVFENMIERSVPGYTLMLDLIGVITARYAVPNTNCYDLGCSLGASTLRIRQHLPASCHVIGVDSSADMVQRCRTNVELDHSQASVEIRQQDMRKTSFDNASLVVMNFTLQFIADEDREPLLQKIAAGMTEAGVLILCEKICCDDPEEQNFINDLHLAFKQSRGYSNLEISQKRAALENVLIPNSVATHRERLLRAGFSQVDQIVQSLNFVTLLARKSAPTVHA